MIAENLLTAALCSLAPIFFCIAAGSAIGESRVRWPGADVLVGFGLLTGAFSILAVTTRISLSWIMVALAVLSLVALAVQRKLPGGRSTWIALALVLPILVVAAGSEPVLWDDFWNWLPSAAYLYANDSLPRPDLPASLSIFPGYPQGMPLMIAAASFVGGRLIEAAGPIINVALLAGASAEFADALNTALGRRRRSRPGEVSLVVVAAAVAVTTLFNPGLSGAVVLSSYADCATMAAVGALGLLGIEILARLSTHDGDAEILSWRFGLVAAMLINLKQSNPVLLVLLVVGVTFVGLRDPATRTSRALLQLPRILVPPVVLFIAWRWYVTGYLPRSEQAFRPLADWNFSVLRETLASVADLISRAPLFHAMMWLVTAAGLVFLLQGGDKQGEPRRLAAVCAIVWLGYNAFILIIYVGVMTHNDAEIAADYWRYTMHTALLGLYPPIMALATARLPSWLQLPRPVATGAAVLLALCAMPLRSDLKDLPDRSWPHFIRVVAAGIRQMVPPDSRLLIVPAWTDAFAVGMRYDLWRPEAANQRIDATILWYRESYGEFLRSEARRDQTYLLIQDVAQGEQDKAAAALRLPAMNHEIALFVWRNGDWEKVKSWPVPDALFHGR